MIVATLTVIFYLRNTFRCSDQANSLLFSRVAVRLKSSE
jgi:hypothetical protein